jgi:hypothetical protein
MATAAAACGDDDGGSDDADASPDVDAGGDVDADTGPSFQGQAFLTEQAVLGHPELGDGSLILVSFTDEATAVPPAYDQMPGTPFGCKAFEYTPEEFADVGSDQGPVTFTLDEGPEYPECVWNAVTGYTCISVTGSGGDITANGGPSFTLTNDAVTFGADEVGRHIIISDSTMGNDGRFPIVAADDDSVTFINPTGNGMAEDDTAATYMIVAGGGPAGQDDPIADDAALTVELTASDDAVVESFTAEIADIGDSFTLTDESQALLTDIPMDGSEFTVTCDGEGGECNTSQATVINITATDGDITGLPEFLVADPVEKAVVIRCIFLSTIATVNEQASAVLADSGATRLRTSVLRMNQEPQGQANAVISVAAGHAITGFTTPEE